MVDSRTAVEALVEVDPGFVTLCKTLLGDSVDPDDAWRFMYGPDYVVKMSPDVADLATHARQALKTRRGKLVAAGVTTGGVAAEETVRRKKKREEEVRRRERGTVITAKADEGTSIVWMGEFSKVDDEKRQVFGWASIVELDGQPVVDRQGDYISPEDIEKAAYDYVHKSRKGGHQHKRDGDQPFHASNMIESIVFTDEKIEKMGLPEDMPRGWWVGYKVEDDETWSKVKKGEVTGFSIHGRGKRVETTVDELQGM